MIIEDLGWGEHGDPAPVVLTSPPHVLRRVMERLRAMAAAEDAEESEERLELKLLAELNGQIRKTCDQVLADLGQVESSG